MVVIVTRDYFESYLSGVYARIFSRRAMAEGCFGGAIAEGCFLDESWEMALLPGGIPLQAVEFDALAAGARRVGDPDCIVTDISLEPPHQNSALLSWCRSELAYVRIAANMGLDSAMFGLSARWGMYVGTIGTASCVGGDKEFMETFFAHIGGRDAAKKRFFAWAAQEWELSAEHRPPILKRVWGY